MALEKVEPLANLEKRRVLQLLALILHPLLPVQPLLLPIVGLLQLSHSFFDLLVMLGVILVFVLRVILLMMTMWLCRGTGCGIGRVVGAVVVAQGNRGLLYGLLGGLLRALSSGQEFAPPNLFGNPR